MTIELTELIMLFGDKDRLMRIDHLVGRVRRLRHDIEQAQAEIAAVNAAIEDALRRLGITLQAGDAAIGADDETLEAVGTRDDAADSTAASAHIGVPKPRRKPAIPADDPIDARSVAKYANALDEVGHEPGA